MSARRWRDDRGLTLPIVALCLPILVLMVGMAVDLGRQRSDRRLAQAGADVVALDMMRVVQGRSLDEVISDPTTTEALTESAERNGFANEVGFVVDSRQPRITDIEWGTVPADADADAFAILDPADPADLAEEPTAVRITAERATDYFFQPGDGAVTRRAVASIGSDNRAGFEIGSFGASLDSTNAGLLNSFLTPVLGSPAGFDALSYQGLAVASVGVEALAAELGILTSDDVFTEEVTYDEALIAAANVLEREGGSSNIAAASALRGAASATLQNEGPITLGDLVSAEPGAQGAALATQLNVLDLVAGGAFLAQCTDPTDLATCSALNIPAVALNAGMVDLGSSVRVIQGKVRHFGEEGTGTTTNQTEVNLAAQLTTDLPCSSALACTLAGVLGGALRLDVEVRPVVKLADARGTIDRIDCTDPGALELDVATSTGLYNVTQVITIRAQGIVGGLLGTTTLRQGSNALNSADVATFVVPPDVYGQTVEETGNGTIGLTGLSTLPAQPGDDTAVLGTIGTLTGRTTAEILDAAVNPLLTSLNAQILGPLTDLLGVNVVGSDVTPLEILCQERAVKLIG